jgi:hypothetical protein
MRECAATSVTCRDLSLFESLQDEERFEGWGQREIRHKGRSVRRGGGSLPSIGTLSIQSGNVSSKVDQRRFFSFQLTVVYCSFTVSGR